VAQSTNGIGNNILQLASPTRGTQDIILKHRVEKLRQGLLGTHPPKSGTLTLIIFYKWKYKKYIYARALFQDFPAPHVRNPAFLQQVALFQLQR